MSEAIPPNYIAAAGAFMATGTTDDSAFALRITRTAIDAAAAPLLAELSRLRNVLSKITAHPCTCQLYGYQGHATQCPVFLATTALEGA